MPVQFDPTEVVHQDDSYEGYYDYGSTYSSMSPYPGTVYTYSTEASDTVSSGFKPGVKQNSTPKNYPPVVQKHRGGDSSETYEDYQSGDYPSPPQGGQKGRVPTSSSSYASYERHANLNQKNLNTYNAKPAGGPLGGTKKYEDVELPPDVPNMPDPHSEVKALREQNLLLRKKCRGFISEIQELSGHVTNLNAQLARSKNREYTDTSAASVGGVEIINCTDAELQKQYQELAVQNRSLADERNLAQKHLDAKNEEIASLKRDMKELIDDISKDEEKKMNRKNWFGTKKKYKEGQAAQTANQVVERVELETADDEFAGDRDALNRIKAKEAKKRGAYAEAQRIEMMGLRRQIDRLEDQNRHLEEERVRLEKERALQEGETKALQRERFSDKDRLNKLEAHNELLKNQQRHAATETALTYSKAIKIPLPDKDGNTELDRMRVMVQIQEDALRRVTVQKDQLQDMLDNMERHLPSGGGGSDQSHAAREAELTRISAQLSALHVERTELDMEVKRLRAKVHNLEGDNSELKKTVQHLSHNLSKSARRDKEIKQKQASMIGQALTANEDLASQLAKMKMKNIDDLMSTHGEIKTLFSGRANEPTSEYHLKQKLYPTVTAKRYTETHPTIEKGSMIHSVAQTDPLMISIAGQHRATISSSETEESISDIQSESSYAYTYIEEDLVVPREGPAPHQPTKGIQILVGGHQGLPAALRHGSSAPISATHPSSMPGDEYDRIAKDQRTRNLASQALKSWNEGVAAQQQGNMPNLQAPPLK